MTDPRYPVGKFQKPGELTMDDRKLLIDQIAEAPAAMRAAVAGLSPSQFKTPYREGGWTVQQVVHHVPDSHMNAYSRFKMALTQDNPTISPFMEDKWAELSDSHEVPHHVSLTLLESLHTRWLSVLRAMKASDFARTLFHPEHGQMRLDDMLALYSWHGRHHVAHITSLRQKEGW
jgi:uncharacterized damage-inducible protein DinB